MSTHATCAKFKVIRGHGSMAFVTFTFIRSQLQIQIHPLSKNTVTTSRPLNSRLQNMTSQTRRRRHSDFLKVLFKYSLLQNRWAMAYTAQQQCVGSAPPFIPLSFCSLLTLHPSVGKQFFLLQRLEKTVYQLTCPRVFTWSLKRW